jgi:membrane-associated phospholipid phosphatase
MVNGFDSSILLSIDRLVGKYPDLDKAIQFVVGNDLIQGTFAASMFWWYWFRKGSEQTVRRTREHLVATFLASVAAIIAGRALALSLPFRIRPRWEPTLHYVIPYEPDPNAFMSWSSFPSDHAVLFTALATGFCFVSMRTGLLLFAYYLLVGAFPLMYIGGHYPTDIIAGCTIGILIGCTMNTRVIRERLSPPVLKFEQVSQSAFVVTFFLLTFQIASTFVSLRSAGLALSRFIARHL